MVFSFLYRVSYGLKNIRLKRGWDFKNPGVSTGPDRLYIRPFTSSRISLFKILPMPVLGRASKKKAHDTVHQLRNLRDIADHDADNITLLNAQGLQPAGHGPGPPVDVNVAQHRF
jgi:hypothetical protein